MLDILWAEGRKVNNLNSVLLEGSVASIDTEKNIVTLHVRRVVKKDGRLIDESFNAPIHFVGAAVQYLHEDLVNTPMRVVGALKTHIYAGDIVIIAEYAETHARPIPAMEVQNE